MNTKFTKGPWFKDDATGRIWRRPLYELYENGGSVAGDKPLATVHIGWNGENETGYPMQANAALIASAPELYGALEQIAALYIDDRSSAMHKALCIANKALKKARGEA